MEGLAGLRLQKEIWNKSVCNLLAPTSDKFSEIVFESWGAGGVVFLAIPPILLVIMLAIYFEEIHYILLKSNSKDLRNSLLWILGSYPAVLLVGTVAVFTPRSLVVLSFISEIYLAYAEYKYFYLIITFAGGTKSFVDKTTHIDVGLNNTPCCCLICLPKVKNSVSLMMLAKWMIFQNVIMIPFYGVIAMLLKADYKLNDSQGTNPALYLAIFYSLSAVVCMYGFNLMFRIAKKIEGMEKLHAIKGKTLCMTLITFVTEYECLIFSVLDYYNVFPCEAPFNFRENYDAFSNYAMILQVFVLGIVARRYYRRKEDIQRQAFLTDDDEMLFKNQHIVDAVPSSVDKIVEESCSYGTTEPNALPLKHIVRQC
uniref:organic solute transporter subunit alpha isoform X2 n=1 Tax=Ciona intestinalis TaxID=7719 RepID=UPI0002B8DF19|nr:organic solute transporter subunit alpha isoform X2 [Ciona intestinalis]|eukprot:XP_009859757.1 organic solute transporter subunit alpha isoform X2 [Ciona intestinalis]